MGKKLFIMGQCTMHWGRMEFGNIGNYYIVKPMFQQLRRVFPDFSIATTLQFSENFCNRFSIETVPMECYYDFESEDNLECARMEYEALLRGENPKTRFINEILKADLIIDFSGDIWGKNADLLGKDRFAAGVYKDLSAQMLKPTVMIAGSPGPFNHDNFMPIAKQAYKGFRWVSNREPISTRLLIEDGFDVNKTTDFACPSFLFDAASADEGFSQISKKIFNIDKIKIGFMLCGWNFKEGPFDVWPRLDEEYINFVELAESLVRQYDAQLFLLSHSNGFNVPPSPFRIKHGRDYPIMQQFEKILKIRGLESNVTLLNGVYTPEITKWIISNFDVLVSGRMHGAVAGLSQIIPTVILDYGHEPKAHKLRGFAEMCNMQGFIADPNNSSDMIKKTNKCIEDKVQVISVLERSIPNIISSGINQFDYLRKCI